MNKLLYNITAVIIITLFFSQELQAESWAPEPLNVVVLDFTVNNVSSASGEIARNRLEILLYENQRVRILERSKYRDIIVQQNRGTLQCYDTHCAAQIGRFLSAEYVVMGSIDRIEDYTINIRVVDAGSGSILYACSDTFLRERDLPQCVMGLSKKINAYLNDPYDEKSFSWAGMNSLWADISAGYIQPVHILSGRASMGFAVNAVLGLQYHNFMPAVMTGYLQFIDRENKMYSSIVPVLGGMGYPFYFTRCTIAPFIAAGICYNKISSEDRSALEFMMRAGMTAGIMLGRTQLFLETQYNYIIETKAGMQFLIFSAGVRYMM